MEPFSLLKQIFFDWDWNPRCVFYIKIFNLTKTALMWTCRSVLQTRFCLFALLAVTTLAFQSFLCGADFPNTACQKSVPSMPCVHTCGLLWRRNTVAVHDPRAGTFHCVTPSEASNPTATPLPPALFGSWGMSPWSHRPIHHPCQLCFF